MKKVALKTLIITFIINAILGISIILLNLWNDITSKILLTTVTIFGFSIPCLICSTNYEKAKNKLIPIIGMTICFVSCIYFSLLIWEIFNFDFLDSLLWKFELTCILLSISFGHICLLLLINSTEKIVKIFRNSTITLSIIMDLFLLIEIFVETELNWKLLSILAILMVLGTIVTPLLDKLNSRTNSSNSHTNDDKYLKLEQLKKLLDDNAITQEEYETEKNKILDDKKA